MARSNSYSGRKTSSNVSPLCPPTSKNTGGFILRFDKGVKLGFQGLVSVERWLEATENAYSGRKTSSNVSPLCPPTSKNTGGFILRFDKGVKLGFQGLVSVGRWLEATKNAYSGRKTSSNVSPLCPPTSKNTGGFILRFDKGVKLGFQGLVSVERWLEATKNAYSGRKTSFNVSPLCPPTSKNTGGFILRSDERDGDTTVLSALVFDFNHVDFPDFFRG